MKKLKKFLVFIILLGIGCSFKFTTESITSSTFDYGDRIITTTKTISDGITNSITTTNIKIF